MRVKGVLQGAACLPVRRTGVVPWLWKVDIDSAYRRVPLAEMDYWAAWVAFMVGSVVAAHVWAPTLQLLPQSVLQVYVSSHKACPFGATASVQAWERIAALITFLARVILRVLVFCYVDDYIGCDRQSRVSHAGTQPRRDICNRPKCAEHAMWCMVRLIRAMFGCSAVADRKVDHGASLVCLGVLISPAEQGFRCELAKAKAEKCVTVISAALQQGILHPGTARKLSGMRMSHFSLATAHGISRAGRLCWAAQFLFRRLGRAMLRPLFTRAHSAECELDDALRTALRWWLMVLRAGTAEVCLLYLTVRSSRWVVGITRTGAPVGRAV